MKKGTYYIGDPCYAFQNEQWDRILNKTNFFDGEVYEYFGQNIWGHGTAFGDGTYFDQHENEYPVDAGIIGCIPIELCDFGEINGKMVNGLMNVV